MFRLLLDSTLLGRAARLYRGRPVLCRHVNSVKLRLGDAFIGSAIPGVDGRSKMVEQKLNSFFLVAIDRNTHCVSHEVSFEIQSVSELSRVLQWDAQAFRRPEIHELDHSEVARLKEHYSIDFDLKDMLIELRPWNRTDALPYKVHTNRELAMMIAGSKPLAVFSDPHPSQPDERFTPEQAFEPHVLAGHIVKREHIVPASENSRSQRRHNLGTRFVLYALPGETWRIEAYLLMRKTAEQCGWSEGFERMEGSLLGYEDWQNDVYIEHQRKVFQSASPASGASEPQA